MRRPCTVSFRGEIIMAHFDMLVIGTGPAGQKAAIQAAKLGKAVGITERKEVVGGVCTNTGTIPSKSLREAVLYLSGFHQRSLYGTSYRVKQDVTMEDLIFRANYVIKREVEIIHNQMARNNVQLLTGTASFLDPHQLSVHGAHEISEHTADYIVIAAGTTPARPAHIPFDDSTIIDTDGLLALKQLPKSLTIIG
ncbi:MAG TPA: FAD-dependent oxidoreductase, partial [Nitrospiraceae bacterium]|nr:FAD-dependent oxidoreductase [Nitrospiraceae bacterium]